MRGVSQISGTDLFIRFENFVFFLVKSAQFIDGSSIIWGVYEISKNYVIVMLLHTENTKYIPGEKADPNLIDLVLVKPGFGEKFVLDRFYKLCQDFYKSSIKRFRLWDV